MRKSITNHRTYGPKMRDSLMSLPTMIITTGPAINGVAETFGSLEYIPGSEAAGFQVNAGIRHFGGAWTNFSKKNFRIYFRREYGVGKLRYPLFEGHDNGVEPVREFDQLNLRAGSHDMVQRGFYMSNRFTDDTMLEMGHINPHGRFVHLYIDGAYWGMYHLRERWNADMQANYLGGDKPHYEAINGNWNVGGWADPGDPYDGDGSAWTRIKSFRGDYQKISPYLDVPNYIDFMLLFMFGHSEGEYRCVGPADVGSGFKFFLNDADGYLRTSAGNRTKRGAPGRSSGDGPGSIFSMLHKEGTTSIGYCWPTGFIVTISTTASLRRRKTSPGSTPVWRRSSWRSLPRRRAGIIAAPPRGPPRATKSSRTGCRIGRGRSSRNIVRPVFIRGSMRRCRACPPAGWRRQCASFLSKHGVAYFTTNGSDPRLPDGTIAPSAMEFLDAINERTAIAKGAVWKYFDVGEDLGSSQLVEGHADYSEANWKHPAFDDAEWKSGKAELGYGEDDEATPIDFGGDKNNKHITVYFRHAFTLESLDRAVSARLELKRDDGAIVYLNGAEVARDNLRRGPVTGKTQADTTSDDGNDFHEFTVPLGLLRSGATWSRSRCTKPSRPAPT